MADRSDVELYRSWADGNRVDGGRLIDRYLEKLAGFFGNKVFATNHVEDLVGTTFERCAERMGDFKGETSFRSYLYRIAQGVLNEYLESHGGKVSDFGTTYISELFPSPSVEGVELPEQTLLLNALRSLSVDIQAAIELSFFEEMTPVEIAEVLDIGPEIAIERLRTGSTLLLTAIKDLGPSPDIVASTQGGLEDWARAIAEQLMTQND